MATTTTTTGIPCPCCHRGGWASMTAAGRRVTGLRTCDICRALIRLRGDGTRQVLRAGHDIPPSQGARAYATVQDDPLAGPRAVARAASHRRQYYTTASADGTIGCVACGRRCPVSAATDGRHGSLRGHFCPSCVGERRVVPIAPRERRVPTTIVSQTESIGSRAHIRARTPHDGWADHTTDPDIRGQIVATERWTRYRAWREARGAEYDLVAEWETGAGWAHTGECDWLRGGGATGGVLGGEEPTVMVHPEWCGCPSCARQV